MNKDKFPELAKIFYEHEKEQEAHYLITGEVIKV